MANKFTRFLKGVVNGALNPKGQMANWRHATRLFVDNQYALSPRTKFMFYVKFEINPFAAGSIVWKAKHGEETGMMVKSVELPKFTFDQVVKNQYNRKRIVYKQINYDPVTLTLHDDSTGVINAMWALYYGTYIQDRLLPAAAFTNNHYRPSSMEMSNYRYGLDNDFAEPFFKSISIYTMSRRRYNGYTLINPRIQSWQHGSMAYAESGTAESQMTLAYEAVQYSSGLVYRGSPNGFGDRYYDLVPSPLSVAGGGVASLLGDGGVLAGAEQIFGDIASGNLFKSPGGFLNTAIAAINTAKNLKNLTKEGLKGEFLNVLGGVGADAIVNTVGGVVGAIFPTNSGATTGGGPTNAAPRTIVPPGANQA
jgi:hypothetical protein